MRPLRLLSAMLATLIVTAGAAEAQGFFERLFGIAPAPTRPAPPPVYQNVPPADVAPSGEEAPRRAAPPAQARPVSLRVPTEDAIIGRDLKQNGSAGSLRIERGAKSDLRAKLTLTGRRSAQSLETCSTTIGGPEGSPLVFQGRTEGLQRYQLQDASCTMTIDVLDESVLVKGPGEACTFQASNCQADPSGMWGPEPSQLVGRARDFEQTRASADKAVRDNYKVLAQRARPEAVRPIVAEQAAFSSDREVVCRTYAREATHSFCNARYSEGRAISLAARLGVTMASNQPAPTETRTRRRDPYAVPQTDEIIERTPLNDD